MLEFSAPLPASRPAIVGHWHPIFSLDTAGPFTTAFMDSLFYISNEHYPDDFISFLTTCSEILDAISPLWFTSTKPRAEPWPNDATRAFRKKCRKADRQ